MQNVTYAKCYLCLMLPMQRLLHKSKPMQNVTMKKCTVTVTDPTLAYSAFFQFFKM